MSLTLIDQAQVALGNIVLAAASTTNCTDSGSGTSSLDCRVGRTGATGDSQAGNYIRDLILDLTWLQPLLSTVGAILMVSMVLKFVWDRRRGQGGGGLGQVAAGMFGLVLLFNPLLIAGLGDGVIKLGLNLANFVFGRL